MTYGLSIVFATAHVVGVAIAGLIMWIAAVPGENAEDPSKNLWLFAAAPVIFSVALAMFVLVGMRLWRWAAVALVAQAGLALVVFLYAIRASEHSDHQLILFAVAVEAPAYVAVALCARPSG